MPEVYIIVQATTGRCVTFGPMMASKWAPRTHLLQEELEYQILEISFEWIQSDT
jgi:hypothetical protein